MRSFLKKSMPRSSFRKPCHEVSYTRNLSEIFDHDIRKFFMNKETIKVSAEAFNDIAEWSALSKAGTNEIFDLLTSTDIIQQSTTLDYDVFSALASLTITLCESVVEKITDPLTTRNTKALEIMLLLLNSDVSSRTFNFWLCFAETSMDIADGHQGDPWLERALPILLQRSAWRDGDPDEWSAYRMDVVEVFETVCDVLGNDKINSFVFGWLSSSLGDGDVDQRMIVYYDLVLANHRSWKQHCSLCCPSSQNSRWIKVFRRVCSIRSLRF